MKKTSRYRGSLGGRARPGRCVVQISDGVRRRRRLGCSGSAVVRRRRRHDGNPWTIDQQPAALARRARVEPECPDGSSLPQSFQERVARQELGSAKRELTALELAASAAAPKVKEPNFNKEKFFAPAGVGASVPRYMRSKGKVRNRKLPKAATEAMVKEVWRDKESSGNMAMPMEEYFSLVLLTPPPVNIHQAGPKTSWSH